VKCFDGQRSCKYQYLHLLALDAVIPMGHVKLCPRSVSKVHATPKQHAHCANGSLGTGTIPLDLKLTLGRLPTEQVSWVDL